MPDEEGEVVVTARANIKKVSAPEGTWSFHYWFYGNQYGPGTGNANPYNIAFNLNLSANQIVANGCESIAAAIDAALTVAGKVIPKAERTRLNALSQTLKYTAAGLRAGSIDPTTARTLIQSGLSVALQQLQGVGLSILFGALGTYAATIAPTPLTKLLAAIGFGALGFVADDYFNDVGAANGAATALTNGLFNGADAFANAINKFFEGLTQFFESLPGYPNVPREYSMSVRVEETAPAVYSATVFNNGNEWALMSDASSEIHFPQQFDPAGDPKSPWNNDEPI